MGKVCLWLLYLQKCEWIFALAQAELGSLQGGWNSKKKVYAAVCRMESFISWGGSVLLQHLSRVGSNTSWSVRCWYSDGCYLDRDKGEAGREAHSFQRNMLQRRCTFSRSGNSGQEKERISMLRGQKWVQHKNKHLGRVNLKAQTWTKLQFVCFCSFFFN